MKQRSRAHLTLASEGAGQTSSTREVVAIDALSKEQESTARKLITRAHTPGVFVGALVGDETWDIRPLLLLNGKLSLLRFTNPGSALDRNKMNFIRSLYAQSSAQPEISRSASAIGEVDGQLWTLRKFHQNTLANIDNSINIIGSLHPVHQAQRLIEVVSALQGGGIIHGHISLSNIGTDENQPMLLDFGFGALARTGNNLAPEIKAGLPPSLASDIYGLGQVLHVLMKGDGNPEIQNLIERMTTEEPTSRPQISEVRRAFMIKSTVSSGSTSATGTMRGGKLLGNVDSLRQNIAQPIPVPVPKIIHQGPALNLPPRVETPKPIQPMAPARVRHHTTLMPKADLTLPIKVDILTPREKIRRKTSDRIRVEDDVQVAKEASAKLTTKEPSPPQKRESSFFGPRAFLLVTMFTALCSLAVGLAVYLTQQRSADPLSGDYYAFWISEQPSLQDKVVEAAVTKDSEEAQNAIFRALAEGKNPSRVRKELLRIGFNQPWSKEFTSNDKKILLALSVEGLNPTILTSLPPITSAHPGVILALASQLDTSNASLGSQPLAIYEGLPSPYREAFAALSALGVKTIGEPVARGLARIVGGDFSKESFRLFVGDNGAGKSIVLNVLASKLGPEYSVKLLSGVDMIGRGAIPELDWFTESDAVDWTTIPAATKIAIASGSTDFSKLTIEHKLDLLSSSLTKTRNAAALVVTDELGPNSKAVIKVIMSEDNGLTRAQMVTLLSALFYTGEGSKRFVLEWFNSQPDPQTVLNLLMARNSKELSDFFNLQAARYLADKDWQADFSTLKQMSVHHEPVARALAYSKMDPNKREQLLFLRRMSNIEPSDTVRKGIMEKIKPFESKTTLSYKPVEE